jgi:hypothetical protein
MCRHKYRASGLNIDRGPLTCMMKGRLFITGLVSKRLLVFQDTVTYRYGTLQR